MNLLQLAWSYLRARPLGTLLNVLLLALGVGTIGFVRIVDDQLGDTLNRDARSIDLVVGAKGSPMQLILAGIYHLDAPPGNIPLTSVEELARDPLIRRVIPMSLGDSFRGYRIVGTTADYIALYGGDSGVRTRMARQDGSGAGLDGCRTDGTCRGQSVRRLAWIGRRRSGAWRLHLHRGRHAAADRHRARPAGPRQSRKRLVRARREHQRRRRTQSHRTGAPW
jgi:putative ABC transport system permease protein